MCEPTTIAVAAIVSSATQVVGGVMQYYEAKEQAEKQNDANAKQRALNEKAQLENTKGIAINKAVAKESAARKKNELARRGQKVKSAAHASATDNGISGLSVKQMLQDYSKDIDSQQLAVDADLNNQLISLEHNRRVSKINTDMTNASIIDVSGPNLWSTVLGMTSGLAQNVGMYYGAKK